MGEWRDPLWVVRFRFAALLFFSMGILPSNARADIHHSVFGLNPRMAYDVYVGDLAVMVGVYPSPAGDLTFIASVADPVRVVPNGVPHLAGMPSSPARGLGVSPPMPNPTGGSFEIRIDADRARTVDAESVQHRIRRSQRKVEPVSAAAAARNSLAVWGWPSASALAAKARYLRLAWLSPAKEA